MAYQSSYKVNHFSLSTKSEVERLEAQVELFWKKELSLYKSLGLRNGMSIVECGCGTGIVGRKILQEFPESRITAFDIDPYLVETAKENAKNWGLENYEVFERPILNTELPDNKYDFAIARLVLEHLTNPADAIKEIYRILKPNGKAIFVDNDFEFHLRTYPDIPELKDLYGAYCRAREDDGGTPRIGRELPSLTKNSGFSNVDLHIVSAHNSIVGDSIFLKSEGSGIPAKLVKDGYLPSDTYVQIAKKWNTLLKTKGHSIFRQLFLCVGQKISLPPDFSKQEREQEEETKQENLSPVQISGDDRPANKQYGPPNKEDNVQSLTATQKTISGIWSKVLDREWIGNDENFFEAGGSSLYAVDIVELLEKAFKMEISVVDVFDNPTIALFANFIDSGNTSNKDLSSEERKEIRSKKIMERRQKIKTMKETHG
jgi:ubiquinone/menaquinone biosynthesis C-methylase UbiE/acyl carrier protein